MTAALHRMRRACGGERLAQDLLDRRPRRGTRFVLREFDADARGVGLEPELGFVILHRCGQAFYFLLVSTWRGTNELWETVFYKENEAMQDFGLFTFQGAHRGTFCVWELGAVLYEKDAWVRFLESARTAQDQQAYLESRFEGAV